MSEGLLLERAGKRSGLSVGYDFCSDHVVHAIMILPDGPVKTLPDLGNPNKPHLSE
jgi:hypothetical protein